MKNAVLRAIRVLGALVALAGGGFQLSLQARLYLARFRYPWDIEWLESAALYQSYRVMKGLPTYGPPRDGYLALTHPAGYYAFIGYLGRVVGLGWAMARTVSLLFFIGSVALVTRGLVRQRARQEEGRLEGWVLGALAAGCAAAGVPVFLGFYDLVRPDIMAVWLCVMAATLADAPAKMSSRRIAAIAVVLTAIVYTRLPAVFFPIWIVLFIFSRHPRTGFMLALTTTAFCGLTLVGLQFTSKGWYWLYTISLLQDQHVTAIRFAQGLETVFKFAPFIVALPVVAIGLAIRRRLSPTGLLWLGMFVASIPAALLPFAKVGGFPNDYMPVIFMIGPVTAFLVSDVLAALAPHPRVRLALQTVFFAAAAVFLVRRTYDYTKFVPTPDAFRRAAALDAKIASLDGGVLIPRHPFGPIHNGGSALQWCDMPYLDMAWSNYGDVNLGAYIDQAHAKWAVVSGSEVLASARELGARYQLEGPIGDAPGMVIGEHSQMKYLLRLQDSEANARVLFDFESLAGWEVTGNAFQLTTTRPKGQGGIRGAVGPKLANSYSLPEGDKAMGMMTSPIFTIDRPHMAMRIGGGWWRGTRVELRVNGATVRTGFGIWEFSETMTKVVWDVSQFQGKEARLVLIDQERAAWGHLLVDHVVLY